jgi:hypothetical protein
MSRSYRKTPIRGITTAASEKQDKQFANRRLRRVVKQVLKDEPEAQVLPLQREVSDVWAMDKDGKRWFDAGRHAGLMRK